MAQKSALRPKLVGMRRPGAWSIAKRAPLPQVTTAQQRAAIVTAAERQASASQKARILAKDKAKLAHEKTALEAAMNRIAAERDANAELADSLQLDLEESEAEKDAALHELEQLRAELEAAQM